jgi:hypothetical protein
LFVTNKNNTATKVYLSEIKYNKGKNTNTSYYVSLLCLFVFIVTDRLKYKEHLQVARDADL